MLGLKPSEVTVSLWPRKERSSTGSQCPAIKRPSGLALLRGGSSRGLGADFGFIYDGTPAALSACLFSFRP
jgi:hypothetical protein